MGEGYTVDSSTSHTVFTDDYATTDQIIVDNDATLTNSDTGSSAIFVAAEGQLGDVENETAVRVDGTLSSVGTDAISLNGSATGRFEVGSGGEISEGNIHIASGGQLTGTIDVQGTVSDQITINGSQSSTLDDAIKISGNMGSNADANAIIVGANG